MDSRTDNLVGSLLFGDGAAAIVVGQAPNPSVASVVRVRFGFEVKSGEVGTVVFRNQ